MNVALFQWLIRMSYRFISLKYTRLMSFCIAKISLCDVLSLSYSRNKEFAVHSSEAILDVITCNNTKSYEKVVGMTGSTKYFALASSRHRSARKRNASDAPNALQRIQVYVRDHCMQCIDRHPNATVSSNTNKSKHKDLRVSLSTISVLSVPLLRQAIISTTCFVEKNI